MIPTLLFWAEIECRVNVVLPKQPINQFRKADNKCLEFTVLIYIVFAGVAFSISLTMLVAYLFNNGNNVYLQIFYQELLTISMYKIGFPIFYLSIRKDIRTFMWRTVQSAFWIAYFANLKPKTRTHSKLWPQIGYGKTSLHINHHNSIYFNLFQFISYMIIASCL